MELINKSIECISCGKKETTKYKELNIKYGHTTLYCKTLPYGWIELSEPYDEIGVVCSVLCLEKEIKEKTEYLKEVFPGKIGRPKKQTIYVKKDGRICFGGMGVNDDSVLSGNEEPVQFGGVLTDEMKKKYKVIIVD